MQSRARARRAARRKGFVPESLGMFAAIYAGSLAARYVGKALRIADDEHVESASRALVVSGSAVIGHRVLAAIMGRLGRPIARHGFVWHLFNAYSAEFSTIAMRKALASARAGSAQAGSARAGDGRHESSPASGATGPDSVRAERDAAQRHVEALRNALHSSLLRLAALDGVWTDLVPPLTAASVRPIDMQALLDNDPVFRARFFDWRKETS